MRAGLLTLVAVFALATVACSGDDDGAKDAPDEVPFEKVSALASDGCGSSSVTAGEEKVTLQSGGAERWYIRHVPEAHDGDSPVPVVVDFHGYSEGADFHASYTKLGPFGDEKGFVTLTPHGAGEVPHWETAAGTPDMVFVEAMLDEVEATLCVDRSRVFATGLSNGAMMTSAVSCFLADRFAAAAPVAGVAAIADCEPSKPVPVVAFHGTEDPFLGYEGGFGPGVDNLPTPDGEGRLGDALDDPDVTAPGLEDVELSVPEVLAAWGERNGCEGTEPTEESVADDVTLLTFDCPTAADTVLYRVDGGGHTWPGSDGLEGAESIVGTTTFSIDADEIMWDFFERHPKRASG